MVSVIITTKNRVNLLKRAVKSILTQTYNDYELIIIDDGSTDDTKNYVNKLISIYSNIRYYCVPENESNGANKARNIGISLAKGDYIGFLDDDDEWYKEKLEYMVNMFLKSKNDIALVFSEYSKITKYNNMIIYTRIKLENKLKKDLKKQILFTNFVGGTSNPLIKKDALINCGCFDELLKDRDEYELWIRIISKYDVGYVDKNLTKYYFEINNRNQVTSKVESFIDASNYIYNKHSNLYIKLSKDDWNKRYYNDYNLICDRSLLTLNGKMYRKYLLKKLKISFKFNELIMYILSYINIKFVMKLKFYKKIYKSKNI